jgi:hypothetical protein
MEKETLLPRLGNTDVFAFNGKTLLVDQLKTYLWSALRDAAKSLAKNFADQDWHIFLPSRREKNGAFIRGDQWFFDEIDCEVLQVGASGWQKGKLKIKVTVEFEPETPLTVEASSSLLDNLRAVSEN